MRHTFLTVDLRGWLEKFLKCPFDPAFLTTYGGVGDGGMKKFWGTNLGMCILS